MRGMSAICTNPKRMTGWDLKSKISKCSKVQPSMKSLSDQHKTFNKTREYATSLSVRFFYNKHFKSQKKRSRDFAEQW